MKRSVKIAALVLCAVLLSGTLSGCAFLASGEYSDIRDHEYHSDDVVSDRRVVRSYYSLRSQVQQMILAHEESRTVIISNYSGDLEESLKTISSEMTTSNAMGSYLVSSIVFEQSGLMSYQELTVNISYRRTKEEQDGIYTVYSEEEFTDILYKMFSSFSSNGTFYMKGLSYTQDELYAAVISAWRQHPATAIGLKEIVFTAYPSMESAEFVLDMDVSYLESTARLRAVSRQITSAASSICRAAEGLTLEEKLDFIYGWISANVEIDREAMRVVAETNDRQAKTELYTANGALISLKAAEPGVVEGAKALLDEMGIESRIVFGIKDDLPHMWIEIETENGTVFFDPASTDIEEQLDEEGNPIEPRAIYVYTGLDAVRRFSE